MPTDRKARAALLAALLLTSLLGGCAGLGVEPWERDLLAQQQMMIPADPLTAAIDAHVYFSKEASSGGAGLSGGGCGCN